MITEIGYNYLYKQIHLQTMIKMPYLGIINYKVNNSKHLRTVYLVTSLLLHHGAVDLWLWWP